MPRPVLFRIDMTILRDKSPTDASQVPYAGGGVEFYGQGGTSTNSFSITVPAGSSAIPVYDVGDILVGSVLQAGLNGATLSVTAISGATLTVNNAGSSFSLGARTRLILLTNRPTVYADPITITGITAPSKAGTNGDRIRLNW